MTQTQSTELAVGQLVTIAGCAGYFRVTGLPEHGKYVDLYGGILQRRGGIKAGSRAVVPTKVEPITTKGFLKRAAETLHAIDEIMATGHRPHGKSAGSK
jgi:hypothetical protein